MNTLGTLEPPPVAGAGGAELLDEGHVLLAPEGLPGGDGDGVEEPALHLLHQGGLAVLPHAHVHRGDAHPRPVQPAVHQAAVRHTP